MFKDVLEVPKPLLIFPNSCFFILLWLDVYFFLLFQIIDLSPGFLPVIVGSLNILLYFTLGILHLFFHFATKLNQFCEHFDTRALNFPSDRLAISPSLSSLSGVLLCSFTFAIFPCLGESDKL